MKIMEELYEVVIAKIAINVVRRSGEEINRLKALTGSLVYWGAEVGGLVVVPDATDGRWVNVIRPAHWGRPAPPPYIVIPSRIGASAPSTRRDVCHRVRAIAPNPPPRTSQRQRVGRSEILPNNPTVQWARLACVRM